MKKGLLTVGVIAVVGVVFFLTTGNSVAPETATDTTEQPATQQQTETITTFTAADVAAHNTEQDCWTIISGTVYNVSEYVARHPGKREILRACGIDATTLFETRTTDSGETVGSGNPHSSDAQNILKDFAIGQLE